MGGGRSAKVKHNFKKAGMSAHLLPLVTYTTEQFHAVVDRMGPLFDNPAAMHHASWKPTGDWYADAITAWNACLAGETVKGFNSTHNSFVTIQNGIKIDGFYQRTSHMADGNLDFLYSNGAESSFDGTPLSHYMREYYQIPIYASIAYLVVIFGLKVIMMALPPLPIKTPLLYWNLFLAVFSFCGVVRIVPHLFLLLTQRGLYQTSCGQITLYGFSESGLWAFLFIISKFPELVDTLFIIGRKRPLIFLHWYHHFTVLCYCWQSYATQATAGIFFIGMNFTVHAIMYFYYFMKAAGWWPRWIPSWMITILQLLQMVVGVGVCYVTYYYEKVRHMHCTTTENSFQAGAVMYFTYFLLFLQLLVSFLSGGKNQRSSKQKTE